MLVERLGKRRFELFVEDGAAPPAAPTFVPTEAFMQFQTQVLDGFREVNAGLSAIRSSAVADGARRDPLLQEPEKVTTEAYREAINAGDVEVIEKYHARQRYDTVQSLLPSLNMGLHAVSGVVADSASKVLPHYKRFQKEIDDYVGGMTPEMRMSAKAWEIAHNVVVGRNVDVLTKEATEAALRTAADVGNPNPGGGTGSRTGGGGGGTPVPSVEELLGKDAALALTSKGIDADTWSKRLGYKGGWGEYAKQIQEGGA